MTIQFLQALQTLIGKYGWDFEAISIRTDGSHLFFIEVTMYNHIVVKIEGSQGNLRVTQVMQQDDITEDETSELVNLDD